MTREEAIRHLHTYSTTMGSGQTSDEQHNEAKRMAIEALKDKPTGKWVKAVDDGVLSFMDAYAECDQCHKVTFNGWDMNYCPSCGARMRGEEE